MLKKILKSDNGKGNIRFVNFSEMFGNFLL